MLVRIVHEFRDKDNFDMVYRKGESVDFPEARAKRLIEINVVEEIVVTPPKKTKTERKRK
ncbi:MAG: hypothetical protein IJS19_02935 [Muribaculaceae bacterium]|nr:hypothetical protein [Muribaculaceae bacterium]